MRCCQRRCSSFTTMRGAKVIYEEDLTNPSPGSAHYDQVSRKQVTNRIEVGSASTTQHYYMAYGYTPRSGRNSRITTHIFGRIRS